MKSSTKHKERGIADDYFNLVRRFPLRALRTEAECDQANEVLKDLLMRADDPGLSAGERDYFDALNQLIGVFEDKHYPLPGKTTPIEVLKFLMEEHQMSTSDLGKLLGSGKGQASLILHGKRQLSKANIRLLAERFKISSAAFL